MIKSAPWSFLIACGVIVGLTYFGFKERLDQQKELVGYYKERGTFTSLSQPQAEIYKKSWENYKPKLITGKTFVNETVPLDGFHYDRCKFINVTLEYNGDTPIQLTKSEFSGAVIKSKNPSVEATMSLLKNLNYFRPGITFYGSDNQAISPP